MAQNGRADDQRRALGEVYNTNDYYLLENESGTWLIPQPKDAKQPRTRPPCMNAEEFGDFLSFFSFETNSHVADFWNEYGGRLISYRHCPSGEMREICTRPDNLVIKIGQGRWSDHYSGVARQLVEDFAPVGLFDPGTISHDLLMTSSGELYRYYQGIMEKCGEPCEGWRETMQRIIAGESWQDIKNAHSEQGTGPTATPPPLPGHTAPPPLPGQGPPLQPRQTPPPLPRH